MGKIIVHGLKARAFVGVTSGERLMPQPVLIDIELFCDAEKAGASDDVKRTINYDEVIAIAHECAASKKFRLVEAIANEIAKACIGKFTADKAVVRVFKPEIARQNKASAVGAEVEVSKTRRGRK